jgi:hypothetical protein
MDLSLSPRLAGWRKAWQTLSASDIAARYADDAVHESPGVKRLFPGKSRLEGRAAIDEYIATALARLQSFRIEPFAVSECGDVSVIEYNRVANDDEASAIKVCEVIVWRGERVAASRVYHA